ncbi:hypothetical protein [Ottowia testudinis]|uniref:IPTL-CTERM protein sorting domain-containing protein n=1 Tax=Ottowia testudinis TaxID=2816950 RepID=A0A975H4R2_9BURK|nr:hypothetical protein [Ottowia testudinis]QTD47148.1 hypothetical protein J1M35_09915 [Ottowia testudinis]
MAWIPAVVLGMAGLAQAADVDLVVTVSSDKVIYQPREEARIAVRVLNRGPALASGAALLLNLGRLAGLQDWAAGRIQCQALNGAVCPTSYTQVQDAPPHVSGTSTSPGNSLMATLPSLPVRGELLLTVPAAFLSNYYPTFSVRATATPQAGDTELVPSTNVSYINLTVPEVLSNYKVALGAPARQADGTYDYEVTVTNQGMVREDLRLFLTLASSRSPGATVGAGKTTNFEPAPQVLRVDCLGGTGGSTCADVRAMVSGVIDPVAAPAPGAPGVGIVGMPSLAQGGPSSVMFRVKVSQPFPTCGTGQRTLTATAAVNSALGSSEATGGGADNTSLQVLNFAAPACGKGDLRLQGLGQSAAQATNGIGFNQPYEYTATVINALSSAGATDNTTANNVPLEINLNWPAGGATIDSVSCAATGGAVCPAPGSYTIVPTPANPYAPAVQAATTARGIIPSIPTNGTVTFTVRGVSGPDMLAFCGTVKPEFWAVARPPADFVDTAYSSSAGYAVPWPANTPLYNNNGLLLRDNTTAGRICQPTHDLQVDKAGPFTDAAATQAAGNVKPGDRLYFVQTFTNLANSQPLTRYAISDSLDWTLQPPGASASTSPFTAIYSLPAIGTPPSTYYFSPAPGAPGGLPFRFSASGPILGYSGIVCTAENGATCPDFLTPGNGAMNNYTGWGAGWASSPPPPWPATGRLTFRSSYQIPPLARNAVCVDAATPLAERNRDLTSKSVKDYAMTEPAGIDSDLANDRSAKQFVVIAPSCSNALSVTKTVDSTSAGSSGEVVVRFKVVASNAANSSQPIAQPRLVDYMASNTYGNRVVAISCDPVVSTGACPDPAHTAVANMRRAADGSLQPFTADDLVDGSAANGVPLFDVTWGAPGASTLAAGQQVTFWVDVVVVPGAPNAVNRVRFSSTAPGWNVAEATGNWYRFTTSGLVMRKAVVNPDPATSSLLLGAPESVTYAIDVVNAGNAAEANLTLSDPVPQTLRGSVNPAGFTGVTCVPVPGQPGIANACTAVSPTAWPQAADGFNSPAFTLPAMSGFRLLLTLKIPPNIAGATSIDNMATLLKGGTALPTSASAVNIGWLLPNEPRGPAPAQPAAVPTLAHWATAVLGMILAMCGVHGVRRRRTAG